MTEEKPAETSVLTEANEKDFIAFSRICHDYNGIQQLAIFVVIGLIMFFLSDPFTNIINDLLLKHKKQIPFLSVLAPFLCLGVFLSFYYLFAMFLRKNSNSTMFHPDGTFCREKTYTITPEGLSTHCSLENSFTKWEAVHKIAEHDGLFLLYVDNIIAFIIPKRSFKTIEEADHFIKQARSYWLDATAHMRK